MQMLILALLALTTLVLASIILLRQRTELLNLTPTSQKEIAAPAQA